MIQITWDNSKQNTTQVTWDRGCNILFYNQEIIDYKLHKETIVIKGKILEKIINFG